MSGRRPYRWTSLVGSALRARLAARTRTLSDTKQWAENSQHVQHAQLRGLLELAKNTEVGRELGFSKMLTRDDGSMRRAFAGALPVADYERYRSKLARMREQGEPDVTWPGVVRDWAQTSGTTGGEKYIPVSRQMMRGNYIAALDIFAHAMRFGISLERLCAGRLFFLGGSTNVTENEHGIRTGDLSGLVTSMIRWPLTEVYSPGAGVALLEHWPTKIERMAEVAIEQDVRMVSGMASWSLVLMQRILEMARERGSSARTIREIWPDFTLFVHGGVKYSPFESRFIDAWSGGEADIPHRLEVYPASEGFIAVQDTPGDPGLRLHTGTGIFFEFVPIEEIDSPDPRAFMCHEVEKGQRYVVVMTTNAGLWRYVIGDVVEFDTIPPEGPARLRIVGRHRHFINAFGENLIVEEIEDAVVDAQRATGAVIGEFTAAPVYPGEGTRAGLELAIECGSLPSGERAFRDAFDESLKRRNVDYKTKRTDSLGMDDPTLSTLPIGAFHRWMQSAGKLGGQHKAPRAANHREIIEGVKNAANPQGTDA